MRSWARNHAGWVVAIVLFTLMIGGGAFAVGRLMSLKSDRDGWRAAASRAPQPTFVPVRQPSDAGAQLPSPPLSAPVAAPSPPRRRWHPTPPRDGGIDRAVPAALPPADAGLELPEAGAEERVPQEEPLMEPLGPVPCGAIWCPMGLQCCNPTCGICTLGGTGCTQRDCSQVAEPSSTRCNQNTCNVGEVCCNWSCGTCVAQGQTCDQKICEPWMLYPTAETCGMSMCNAGYECCNPSCGTCVLPGQTCSHDSCGW